MRLIFLLMILFVPVPAFAGAWMRDVGTTFLSFGTTLEETGQTDTAIYVEHGLRPNLTLGAKVDMSVIQGRMGDGTAFVFARRPIPTSDRAFKLAYEFGLGSTFGTESAPLIKAALNYGRGINIWNMSGWVTLDGAAEWDIDNDSATYKLDGTVGLNLSSQFQVMMQVFVSQTDSETSTTLAPSLIWQPKEKGSTRYQFGAESEDGTLAVKLGVWRTF